MKNKLFLSLAFGLATTFSYGQFSFSVSPGFSFNGACVGYKVHKNIVPFIGLQFANINFNYEESGKEFDVNDNLVDYRNTNSFKGGVYVPNIGVKHYFKQKNKIRPYTSLNLAKPMLKAKLKTDDVQLDKEVNDAVKKIKIFGMEIGFGTEYFFDDNFSIGGEFGIRHINIKVKDSFTRTLTDPNTFDPVEVQISSEVSTKINPTYTRFALNFYF